MAFIWPWIMNSGLVVSNICPSESWSHYAFHLGSQGTQGPYILLKVVPMGLKTYFMGIQRKLLLQNWRKPDFFYLFLPFSEAKWHEIMIYIHLKVFVICLTEGTLWTVTYVTVHATWLTHTEPQIDMPIAPLKQFSSRCFKHTQTNQSWCEVKTTHIWAEMRCYSWFENWRVARNLQSVQADVNRTLKGRGPYLLKRLECLDVWLCIIAY